MNHYDDDDYYYYYAGETRKNRTYADDDSFAEIHFYPGRQNFSPSRKTWTL